ncbi:MAG TPA: molybdenum cofactor biosynthesis protein MoaE [Actinomycetaceae bacterium]|nr:molybdenum cofactor biosynthesis protein MoaE [Actinomycetaceae bacterium]
MDGRTVRSGIRQDSINGVDLDVGHAAAGATVSFRGAVRNHDQGRGVQRIEYVGHPTADGIIREIVEEARTRPGVVSASALHRVGILEVGDVALLAAASAAHRSEAFAACMWIVDEIKRRLPVWKNQHFSDGTTEWTGSP